MIRQLSVGLGGLDCEVRVFVPSWNPVPVEVNVSGIDVIRSKMHFEVASCGFALGSLPEFKRQVAWADVIHYHFPWPFADILDLVAGVDKPKVVTYHSDIVRQKSLSSLYGPLMNRFLSRADFVVATSEQYAKSSPILNKLNNVEVVPIGIDEKSYPNPSSLVQESVRTQYGQGYFFFVGMLRYYKGLHILLEACEKQDFRVVIAGVGPEQDNLRAMARRKKLRYVEFVGKVSDEEKIALIDNALAMVFPSHLRSEAFGVSLLEGLMRGKPLITAEVGTGTSFVNKDKETGFIAKAADPVTLRLAMEHMAEGSTAARLGIQGRERFERLFTAQQMSQGYKKLYDRVSVG